MIKGILFDMDGLMIESEPLQSKAFETVLKEQDIRPIYNDEGVIQVVGVREKENWEIIKRTYYLQTPVEPLIQRRKEIYEALLKKHLTPKPGLLELLERVKQKKLKMALASSSSIEQINIVLVGLKISHFFNAVVSGGDIENGKPFPDVFLLAAEKLKLAPQDCVVLEDTESGVIAGKEAGSKVIAVPNKFTKSHDFSRANAVVESLEEVTIDLIQNLPDDPEPSLDDPVIAHSNFGR